MKGEFNMDVGMLGIILLFSTFITISIMMVNMFIEKEIYSYIYEIFVIFSLLCIVIDDYIESGLIIPNIYCTLKLVPVLMIICFCVLFIYIKVILDILDEVQSNPIIAFLFCILTNILLFIILFQHYI